MNDFYVYIYKDGNGIPKYVGKGRKTRMYDHIGLAEAYNEGHRKDRTYRFTRWLAKAIRQGDKFTVEKYIENVPEDCANAIEMELIRTYKRQRQGGTLLNLTDGGDGFTSEKMKEIANDPKVKEKQSASRKALLADPEYRARMRAAHTEANRRPHRREQQRAMAHEKWSKPENREAARKRARELWADPIWAEARRAELRKRNAAKRIAK